MQHFLCAARSDAEDRSVAIRAAKKGRAVERAVYVDQARDGTCTIRALTEAVQHLLRAGRTDTEDCSAPLRCRP